jgi:hypothetical protein
MNALQEYGFGVFQLGFLVVVGQYDQDDESDTTQKSKQSQPLGMSFADCVVHAAPNEKDDTHQNEDQANPGSAEDKASENLKKESETDTDVRVGFVFR